MNYWKLNKPELRDVVTNPQKYNLNQVELNKALWIYRKKYDKKFGR